MLTLTKTGINITISDGSHALTLMIHVIDNTMHGWLRIVLTSIRYPSDEDAYHAYIMMHKLQGQYVNVIGFDTLPHNKYMLRELSPVEIAPDYLSDGTYINSFDSNLTILLQEVTEDEQLTT